MDWEVHDRVVGEMNRGRMAELEVAQTAVAEEDMDQDLSTMAAGYDPSEAVPDRAEAEGAGAAIGEAAGVLPTEEDLVAVLEEDSTWDLGIAGIAEMVNDEELGSNCCGECFWVFS